MKDIQKDDHNQRYTDIKVFVPFIIMTGCFFFFFFYFYYYRDSTELKDYVWYRWSSKA